MVATKPSGKVARPSATLERILRYENEALVVKLMKEHHLTRGQAYQLFKDTLRFLWLAVKCGGLCPTPKLDNGWHTFILFTMDYQKFCHKYFGHFIHHRPSRPEDKPDSGEAVARSIELVKQHFPTGLSRNWAFAVSAKCKSRCRQYCKYDCQ